MRINHNISALKANNQLGRNDSAMSKTLEKLTSGLKINSAADDAAGMAISQKMRTQIRGLDKAKNNASDGISVIQTAEGALEEVNSCLQRMRELAVQAANGTYTEEDRTAIQHEINALNAEIQRISESTEFNTMPLLDGTIDRKAYSNNTDVLIVSVSDNVKTDEYEIIIKEDASKAVVTGKAMGGNNSANANKVITAEQAGKININGEDVKICEGDTYDQVFEKIRTTAANSSVYCFAADSEDENEDGTDKYASVNDTWVIDDMAKTPDELFDYAGYKPSEFDASDDEKFLVFVSYDYGSSEEVSVICDNTYLADLLGLDMDPMEGKGKDVQAEAIVRGEKGFSSTATISSVGNRATITDNSGFELIFECKPGTAVRKEMQYKNANGEFLDADGNMIATQTDATKRVAYAKLTVLDAGPMSLHIGANAYQTMEVTIPAVTPKTLGVDAVNMSTARGAQKAIELVSTAINTVSIIRSKLGAYQNRIEHAVANLSTANLNMTESLSRIEDADMAEEMSQYTQYNVLVQAGTSMLAQANQRPQQIISLLQR